MLRISLLCVLFLWAGLASAQTSDRPENFFRISQSASIPAPQPFDRKSGYYKMLVHDTNIYAANDTNRELLDWFKDQINPQRRAVAHVRVIIGTGENRRVSATNFAEIYNEFASSSNRARYRLASAITTSGLELLPVARLPETTAPQVHVAYYGVVEDRRGGGLATTLNTFLPIAMSPKIGAAVVVVDQAISAYDKVSTALYDTSGRGKLFAGGVSQDPFAQGAVLSAPGFWVMSHDLSGNASRLIVHRDTNGYHRLYYKTAEGGVGNPVLDKTYALIEVRSIKSRLEGPDTDYGNLKAVVASYDKAEAAAGEVGVDTSKRRKVASDFYDWLRANASIELSIQDMSQLAKRVVLKAIEQECQRSLFVSTPNCEAEKLEEISAPPPAGASPEDVVKNVLIAQDALKELEAKEVFLAANGWIKADGTVDLTKQIQGLTARTILNSEAGTFSETLENFNTNSLNWTSDLGVLQDFSLTEQERIELELQEMQFDSTF